MLNMMMMAGTSSRLLLGFTCFVLPAFKGLSLKAEINLGNSGKVSIRPPISHCKPIPTVVYGILVAVAMEFVSLMLYPVVGVVDNSKR